jgi:hypothetical protein
MTFRELEHIPDGARLLLDLGAGRTHEARLVAVERRCEPGGPGRWIAVVEAYSKRSKAVRQSRIGIDKVIAVLD